VLMERRLVFWGAPMPSRLRRKCVACGLEAQDVCFPETVGEARRIH
jgi:hypothetical protein